MSCVLSQLGFVVGSHCTFCCRPMQVLFLVNAATKKICSTSRNITLAIFKIAFVAFQSWGVVTSKAQGYSPTLMRRSSVRSVQCGFSTFVCQQQTSAPIFRLPFPYP